MGLISGLFGLPLAPARGVTWVAEQLKDQAERELYDPAVVRRHLEEVAAAKERGAISEEQASAIERELVARLLEGTRRQSEEH